MWGIRYGRGLLCATRIRLPETRLHMFLPGDDVCRTTTRDSHTPCLWIWYLIWGPGRSSLPSRPTALTPRLVGGDLTHSCRVRAGVSQGPDALPIHPVGPLISLYCRSMHRGVPGVDLRSWISCYRGLASSRRHRCPAMPRYVARLLSAVATHMPSPTPSPRPPAFPLQALLQTVLDFLTFSPAVQR